MIGIRINGEFLDLVNTEVQFKSVSPIFAATSIYGEYTPVPLTVVNNDKTRRLIGFPGIMEVDYLDREIACDLWMDGIHYKNGKMVIKDASESVLLVVIKTGAGALADAFQRTHLSELDERMYWPVTMPWVTCNIDSSSDFIIYYADVNAKELMEINSNPWSTVTIPNPWNGSGFPTLADMQQIVDDINGRALPFTAQVVDNLTITLHHTMFSIIYFQTGEYGEFGVDEMNGIGNAFAVVAGRIGSTDLIAEWQAHLSDKLTSDIRDYTFPVIHNESNPSILGGYFNYYSTSGEVAGGEQYLSPQFFLPHVLTKIFEPYGLTVEGNLMQEEWFRKILIYGQSQITDYVSAEGTYYPHQGFINSWIMGHHLPDVSIKDFLRALTKYLGIWFSIDVNKFKVTVKHLTPLLKSTKTFDLTGKLERPVKIMTTRPYSEGFTLGISLDSDDVMTADLKDAGEYPYEYSAENAADLPLSGPVFGDLAYVIGEQAIYTFNGTFWNFLYRVRDVITVGDGDENMVTPFCQIEESVVTDSFGGRDWLVPHLNQQPSLRPTLPGDITSFPEMGGYELKLLNYHGMQLDSEGNFYPLATQGVVNYAGSVVGTKALRFTHDVAGLFELHEAWYLWLMNARSAEATAVLTPHEINQLEPDTILTTSNGKFLVREFTVRAKKGMKRYRVEMDLYLL